jgi:hypothetical protein
MNMRRLSSRIFGKVALSTLVALANAQMTDQAAREQARNAIRSQLHLKPGQFLHVQRVEKLEQSLAIAVGVSDGSELIYEVNQAGDEVRGDAVIHHVSTDADLMYIIAISRADGSTYRIHGFSDSLAEFEKLMTAARPRVSSPEQAESLAEFYRGVNPENLPLTPISSLIEFKQAAERQCQSSLSSFNTGQQAFAAWWNRAKPLYAEVPFRQTAAPRGSGYRVEWIVLSSAAPGGTCGGVPLRAQLEVSSDGHVGKVIFSPLHRG